jgi:hypothetical protein
VDVGVPVFWQNHLGVGVWVAVGDPLVATQVG